MTQQATYLTEEAVRELSRRFNEPDWLTARRVEAWRAFESMAMPTGLEEEWRRTDISGLDLDGALSRIGATGRGSDLPAALTDKAGLDGLLLQKDGLTMGRFRSDGLDPRVLFADLNTAASEWPDLVQAYLGCAVPATEWKLQALAAALWTGGGFVHVPAGVEVALPLRYLTAGAIPGASLFTHLLIVAEEGCSVTVIQDAFSPDTDRQALVSGAVEIVCGPQARVRFFDVQRWGKGTFSFETVRARLDRGAEVLLGSVGLGGRLSRARIEAILQGESARAELLGVSLGNADQHFDYQTLQDHKAPRTVSDLLFKAALTDSASEVWGGTVRIHKGASGSDANQTSRNLLLSDHAKAAPIPVLEIEQYDILRCSHGATAGPIDEEQLFYLESRAIEKSEAEKLLVEAFFHQVLDRIPAQAIRESVQAALQEKLRVSKV